MANELACSNCGMGFTPTCHITRQKFSSSECRVRYNNAKRYYTDTPVNECPECGTPIQQSGEAGRWRQCEKEEACVPMKKSTVPPALLPGSGIVSASLLAQIMHSKYVLALPLYRQEQELRRLGLPVSGSPCPTGSLLPESAGSCRYITRCTRSFLQIRSCMRMKRRSWCCGSRSVRHGSAAVYGATEPPAMRCGLLCFMITSRAEPASARAGS